MNAIALLLAELTPPAADLVFVGVTVAFFAGAIAFARFCEKVR
ncbi:MAG TPA: hypothetical protein VLT83_11475 [Opitutaceae bacterium]|nr:hypothetical protein [Opitutaceae bacterium]